jgi:uracil-DNA glycosylase
MSEIIDLVLKNVSEEWRSILIKKDTDIEDLEEIYNVVSENCTPSPELWFEWARQTPLLDIKVIIIGQDPYPTPGIANGLAFSSLGKVPDSLRNIFKCLEKSELIDDYKKTTPDLSSWAQQGVLLINTALSTSTGDRYGHGDLWNNYMKRVLVRILQYHLESNLIIMCWGNEAIKLITKITNKTVECFNILSYCHPSPLNGNKFIDCNHFTCANEILNKLDRIPINWGTIRLPDPEPTIKQIIFTDGSAVSKKKIKVQKFEKGKKIIKEKEVNKGNKKDNSCVGGYAVIFVDGPLKGELYGKLNTDIEYASNIRAEGKAIICALHSCFEIIKKPMDIDIYTDCEFWINMLTKFMPKWSDDKFKEKENSDLTIEMWDLWRKVNGIHRVSLHHVYSHNKTGLKDSSNEFDKFLYINNENVDKLATYARIELEQGKEIFTYTIDKEYK